jgi:hypothetical protein
VPGGVYAQQLAQVLSVPERIGHQRAGRERDRGVDPSVPDGDEMGAGRKGRRVALRDARQAGGVGGTRGSEGDRLHEASVAVNVDLRKMLL